MNNRKYLGFLFDAKHQNKRLWMLVGGLTIIVFILSAKVYKTENNEKTIIVPSSFNKPFSVKGNEYSNEYKEQVVLFVLNNLLTFQPSNAKYQFGEVLRWVHPKDYPTLKAKLNAELRKIIADSSSSVFYINGVRVSGDEVIARGEIVGFVGGNEVSRRNASIKVPLDTQNGFYITGWSEVANEADPVQTEQQNENEADLIGDVQ
ncbi:TPA: conjugal transfer protein TraE [Acinetobacter baumannii]|uniref:TraE/TraK family type IV conjugative transfer system protein n=1 Tax=Acinetobacter calcoaceticus/baumannii complex TaxID=909768 RepID=UPI0002833994|nr:MULTISPECIES: TraE/TraK family type IV conjugative transfer system protein [Acinetobacter calcoaceticus/baumannii complex]EHU3033122.1 conjugal transfer protein TraE [Acinetobacter baumannii]EIB7144028.1 conjugal transfer protein TraE [Acinetobacter baumannii]EKA71935.1 putative type IV conjugative transfer system protein TraE [Acinetobacter baumannii IS-58]EKK06220.1 putative type IV conjugative transfer system protein TraE [Acinetobacter baumannii IS-235]EKU0974543.1 conjugal transfer pro